MGITEEYSNKITEAVKDWYNSNKEIEKASKELASLKGMRVMSGRYHTDKLFKKFHQKYGGEIYSQAIGVLDLVEDQY